MMDNCLIGVIFVIVGSFQINGDTIGRLITPEEGCGLTKVKNTRIVGGSVAPIGAWPWIAVLAYAKQNDEITFDCGGSLITSRHVLTAAHCVESPSENLVIPFVRLGEHDLGSDDEQHQDIPVSRIVPHEYYNALIHFSDIAMIYLERDVEFSDRIRPICLPLDEPLLSRSFVNANAFVAGWGDTHHQSPSQVLMQLQVPIVDTKRCKQLIMRLNEPRVNVQIHDHVLCARLAGGQGVWVGDSGGPLMVPIYQNGSFPFYQIGIVSFGFGVAADNVPDIYTKIQYYAKWIKDRVEATADV